MPAERVKRWCESEGKKRRKRTEPSMLTISTLGDRRREEEGKGDGAMER
jgi:hypothetical protein